MKGLNSDLQLAFTEAFENACFHMAMLNVPVHQVLSASVSQGACYGWVPMRFAPCLAAHDRISLCMLIRVLLYF